MMNMIWSHKYKILGAIVLLLVITTAYVAYTDEVQACKDKGGTIVYDTDDNKVYCDIPRPRPRPKKRNWLDEFWNSIIGY